MLIAVLSCAVMTDCFAQLSALDKPAANLSERWTTNSSGWSASDSLCGWTNGELAIKCQLQAVGDGFGKTLTLVAKPGASGDIFFGDYSKIEAVSFDVKQIDMTISPFFYFKSPSGGKWSLPFLGYCVNGQKINITIPLGYSSSWKGYSGSDAEMYFNSDKTNICEVGFEFWRGPNDLKAQQFLVDNMKLVGPWGGPWSNGVPLAWVMESGLTNNFATAGLDDNDGDKFTNAAEFLAGTDPLNSSSNFKIEIARNSEGKLVVKWHGNTGVNFELQEANSLGSDGVFEPKTNIAPTTIKTEEVVVGQDESNSKFFKVVITPKN